MFVSFNKKLLMHKVDCDFQELSPDVKNRVDILFDDVRIPLFFSPPSFFERGHSGFPNLVGGDTSKLLVYLNATDPRGLGVNFNRISWSVFFNTYALAVDDPTRKLNNIHIGWYFNSKLNIDYTTYIYEIVNNIAREYSIKYSDIIFIGSSNAGFAAIKLCSYFNESKAICFNPQFDVQTWIATMKPDLKQKFHKLGYCGRESDIQNCLNLKLYINNLLNQKIFISYSMSYRPDLMQYKFFMNQIEFTHPDSQLDVNKNFCIYRFNISSKAAHNLMPPISCFRFLLNFVYRDFLNLKEEDLCVFPIIHDCLYKFSVLADNKSEG